MMEYSWGHITPPYEVEYTSYIENDKNPFFLRSIGEYNNDGRYFTKRDGFPYCQFIYTLEGNGDLEYMNKKTLLIPNSLIVINCFQYHLYKTEKDHWHTIWIHCGGRYTLSLVDFINENGLFITNNIDFRDYYKRIKELADNKRDISDYELSILIHSLLMEMIRQKSHLVKSNLKRFTPSIENAVSFIKENYHQRLQLREIAKASSISKFYFIRIFTDIIGTTPYNYLTSLRINESKKLLLNTDLSVQNIAEAVGFSDANIFIKNFKKFTGNTPSNFRLYNPRSIITLSEKTTRAAAHSTREQPP